MSAVMKTGHAAFSFSLARAYTVLLSRPPLLSAKIPPQRMAFPCPGFPSKNAAAHMHLHAPKPIQQPPV